MLKISSFCSGIGSFEQAIKNLGIEHENVFGCEIDKYARQTYLSNHECNTMYHDMTKYDYEGEEFYSDINVSGIPCQSFSLAGKRLGELDPRGLLFYDFYRYVKNQQPKYFIIENVKGLLSDNDGNTFQNWINLLGQSVNGDQFMFPHEDSLMYNLHWQVLNTKDYGLPQNRERVFLIGIRNDLPNSFVFPKGVPLKLRLKDILEDNVDEKYYLSAKMIGSLINHQKFNAFNPTFGEGVASCVTARVHKMGNADNYIKDVVQVGNTNPSGNGMNGNVFSENGILPTLTTNKGEGLKIQVAQALTTSCNQGVMIGAMRGRNPENPSDRTTGAPTEQMLEINENGTSNCLTSVQKDNLVVEYSNPKVKYNLSGGKWDKMHEQSRRVYDENGIAPTIHTMGGGNQEIKTFDNYRIRKLTPLECFRLQGFSDQFHQNAVDEGVSASQRYKQAGNSISVPVIQAILKNLLTDYV